MEIIREQDSDRNNRKEQVLKTRRLGDIVIEVDQNMSPHNMSLLHKGNFELKAIEMQYMQKELFTFLC